MLQQQECVADGADLAGGDDALLQGEAVRVGDSAERDEVDVQLAILAAIFENELNRLR